MSYRSWNRAVYDVIPIHALCACTVWSIRGADQTTIITEEQQEGGVRVTAVYPPCLPHCPKLLLKSNSKSSLSLSSAVYIYLSLSLSPAVCPSLTISRLSRYSQSAIDVCANKYIPIVLSYLTGYNYYFGS